MMKCQYCKKQPAKVKFCSGKCTQKDFYRKHKSKVVNVKEIFNQTKTGLFCLRYLRTVIKKPMTPYSVEKYYKLKGET